MANYDKATYAGGVYASDSDAIWEARCRAFAALDRATRPKFSPSTDGMRELDRAAEDAAMDFLRVRSVEEDRAHTIAADYGVCEESREFRKRWHILDPMAPDPLARLEALLGKYETTPLLTWIPWGPPDNGFMLIIGSMRWDVMPPFGHNHWTWGHRTSSDGGLNWRGWVLGGTAATEAEAKAAAENAAKEHVLTTAVV